MIVTNHLEKNPPPLAPRSAAYDPVRVLFVVEGTNGIEFLRRLSLILHTHDRSLPQLAEMEQRGR
jgi:hypothetical protein